MKEMLPSRFDAKTVEKGKYEEWIKAGYFQAGDQSKPPYCIVIPPPNVTGKLHLGHAWDTTMQDIMARYKRLRGFDVLYLPGMDHAGIATQAKIDAKLKEEGTSRFDLGREKFLEVAWQWKEDYATIIRGQWAKMGLSLDYSRERFTLDEGLNHAVNTVFVQLYNEGLIYQGWRIINWDPLAKTALSNIEVIHKDIEGFFYTFTYTVVETGQQLAVMTTRPETMFADVCLVVHPDDPRYQGIIGLHAVNPANGEALPIIADDYIDISFGTGVMKCTPAHDPNDFQLGERHHLEMPICMNPDATMNELAGIYEGMDRFACRTALVEALEAKGAVVSIEQHMHSVGHSERTDAIVEPYLSKQWFVKMKPLAQAVLDKQAKDDPIHFYPQRFEDVFTRWLDTIEDWCISRQLWWGHRIPAWFHKETHEIYVGMAAPEDIENYDQDEDVLDTWFSSALWPFSTLGWPEKTADFERYYPTSFLSTGYDIILFWVSRMAFQARHFTDQVPFQDCLIHGLIRDERGRKMSKSLGNGIDPMDVIDTYGVDALRFFLIGNSTPGQDLRYSTQKVEAAWNFINKIYNASRFVLLNCADYEHIKPLSQVELGKVDRWIIHRLNEVIVEVQDNIERYEFVLVAASLQRFIWDDYCSWYIELAKTGLASSKKNEVEATLATLVYTLDAILKLIHPFMPFVSEEIYQHLPQTSGSICVSSWPEVYEVKDDGLQEVDLMLGVIAQARKMRSDYGLKPTTVLLVAVHDQKGESFTFSAAQSAMCEKLGRVEIVTAISGDWVEKAISGGAVVFAQDQLVDKAVRLEKLQKEKARLEAEIRRSKGLLNNEKFMSKAAPEKVAEERAKCEEYERQYDVVMAQLG